jgi:AAA+ ATPase superfamily predicted ATPase
MDISVETFINREKELEFLTGQYKSKNTSFVVIYGRRRVGKTALISRFIQDKPALYFLATEEREEQNRNAFRQLAAEYAGNELLAQSRTNDWFLIFKALFESKNKERLVLILDEFQYLAGANPAFPSIIQKIWDTFLITKNVMLILCGSSVSMMESTVLSYGSPLYGRRTGQLRLQPIAFSHYKKFFPKRGEKDLIGFYAVTGGIPKYMEFFQGTGDVYSQISRNILSSSSFLYHEPAFLLQKEITEVGSYFSIIKSIAAGNRKLAQLAADLGIKQTSLTKYLSTLASLDIIEREVPVTEEKPEKSKRGLYRIKDNFLQFWFRFVFPNLHYIETGRIKIAELIMRNNFIDNHASFVYEDICREKMWDIDFGKKWGFDINRCGRWWDGHDEIDIAAYDSAGTDIILGECKYTIKKTGMDVLRGLEIKSRSVLWKREERRDHFILFSISGYTEDLLVHAEKRQDLILMPAL